MSAPHGPHDGGITEFAFTPENVERAEVTLARYPPEWRQSAVLPLLTLAQDQVGGWLPRVAIDHVADVIGMPRIRAYEVASFYDMYNTAPVGRIQVRVCTTTPCMLCGSGAVLDACKRVLGIGVNESTPDGRFFLREFECLGACANAPIVWIDDDYYEDLTPETITAVLEALISGERPTPGSQADRTGSMPAGGRTTLTEHGSGDAA
jgi:NADH-quinone oxidoreductase subunit E